MRLQYLHLLCKKNFIYSTNGDGYFAECVCVWRALVKTSPSELLFECLEETKQQFPQPNVYLLRMNYVYTEVRIQAQAMTFL